MPQNIRLASILTTEKRTTQAAEWFLEQLERIRRAAPENSIQGSWPSGYGQTVVEALDFYRKHRKSRDKDRKAAFERLFQDVIQKLNVLRSSLGGLPAVITEAELEAAISSLIDNEGWTFHCSLCARTTSNSIPIDEVIVCDRCRQVHAAECSHCHELHLTDNMSSLVGEDGHDVHYCRDHAPKDMQKCTCCNKLFEGAANNGHAQKKQLSQAGIQACAHCAPQYRLMACGHWHHSSGYKRHVIVNTEDDNRIGEQLRNQVEYVCEACHLSDVGGGDDDYDGDDDQRYWGAGSGRLNGSLFTELGSTRTYGVELEFCRVSSIPKKDEDIKTWWSAKPDGSLPNCGVEFASTILHGDEGLEVIRDLCDTAKERNWQIDARGGLHLHIGLSQDTPRQVAQIAVGYAATYELWRWFVPPSRSTGCKYCRALRTTPQYLLGLSEYGKYPRTLAERDDRRVWVNWHCYTRQNTVEIRLHHATRMYEKVANWVKAHLRFCDWCASFKTPKELFAELEPHMRNPRALLLIIGTEAWKDRALTRWFRERSVVLHGDKSRLQSHRSLRKAGHDPLVAAKEKMIDGRPVHVTPGGGSFYLTDTGAFGSDTTSFLRDDMEWSHGDNAFYFRSAEDAELFVDLYHDGAPVNERRIAGKLAFPVTAAGTAYIRDAVDRVGAIAYIQNRALMWGSGNAKAFSSFREAVKWLEEHCDQRQNALAEEVAF